MPTSEALVDIGASVTLPRKETTLGFRSAHFTCVEVESISIFDSKMVCQADMSVINHLLDDTIPATINRLLPAPLEPIILSLPV